MAMSNYQRVNRNTLDWKVMIWVNALSKDQIPSLSTRMPHGGLDGHFPYEFCDIPYAMCENVGTTSLPKSYSLSDVVSGISHQKPGFLFGVVSC